MGHRDTSFRIDGRDRVSSSEPGRSSHMLGMSAAKLIPQRTTDDKFSKPWSNIMRTDPLELQFDKINGNAAHRPKDMGTTQSVT